MTKHKFNAGQRVVVVRSNSAPSGRYRVIGAQPQVEGRARYRVKGEVEPHERVVDEADIRAEELLD